MKIKAYAAVLLSCVTLAATIPLGASATLFENDQVKVVRALEKPHVKGKFHDHAQNRVMIYLQPGWQHFEYQDGRKPELYQWKAGDVKWSPADGMHLPEVISEDAFNIIEIELKSSGTGKAITSPLDPVKTDPKHYLVEFENAQVRVLRVKIDGHGVAPMHEHTLNRVTVFLTDQESRTTDSHANAEIVKHKAGDVVLGTPAIHAEENLSDNPFQAVVVEVKS
jgi:uncharacterized RmlC-like cupin family protein